MRVTSSIADESDLQHLHCLLEFLAAWEKRPALLTPMAYRWCSTISEVAGRLKQEGTSGSYTFSQLCFSFLRRIQRQRDPAPDLLFSTDEVEFFEVGPGCAHVHSDGLTLDDCADILSVTLEVGFRLTDRPVLHSNYTFHHDWALEVAFSNDNDEVVADAMCAWIADGDCVPAGSCVRHLAKRVEMDVPFSPRLRRVSIRVIECIWPGERRVSELETVRLLNRLDVDLDDMEKQDEWARLLECVVRSPTGLETLSSHYWWLLDKLEGVYVGSAFRGTAMRLLENAEDWEKLEVWMPIVWRSAHRYWSMQDFGRVTLNLLLRRPSALPRFEDLCETGRFDTTHRLELRRVCDQVRAELVLAPESLPQ